MVSSVSPFESKCLNQECESCPIAKNLMNEVGGVIRNFDLRSQDGQMALSGFFAGKAAVLSDSCLPYLSKNLSELNEITEIPQTMLGADILVQSDIQEDQPEVQETQTEKRLSPRNDAQNLLTKFFRDSVVEGYYIKDKGLIEDPDEAIQEIQDCINSTTRKTRRMDLHKNHRVSKRQIIEIQDKPGKIEI
jgi:hypothetical protein